MRCIGLGTRAHVMCNQRSTDAFCQKRCQHALPVHAVSRFARGVNRCYSVNSKHERVLGHMARGSGEIQHIIHHLLLIPKARAPPNQLFFLRWPSPPSTSAGQGTLLTAQPFNATQVLLLSQITPAYLVVLLVFDLLYAENHSSTVQGVRHPQHVLQVFVLPTQETVDGLNAMEMTIE